MALMENRQACGRESESSRQKLETLQMFWGLYYEFGTDGDDDWHADRRDGLGGRITAPDPDRLQPQVAENFAMKPVGYAPAGGTR
jgi:hypothetical protein